MRRINRHGLSVGENDHAPCPSEVSHDEDRFIERGENIMKSLFKLYSNGSRKYVIAETIMDAVTFYEEKKEGEIVSSIKELGADIEIKGIYE